MSERAGVPSPDEVEVLIVGAGPTGLVAANLLGRAGVRALLIEQNPALSALPKALMVDDEFFRLLHTLGLGDALAAHGVHPVGYDYFSPLGPRVGRIAGRITENGFPSRTATFQPEFEQILFAGIGRFPSVRVLFGRRLASIAETDNGIDAVIADATGGETRVRASYLIAADGSHSLCRKALGIAFEELAPVEVRHIVVDVAGDPNTSKTADLRLGWRRNANSLPAPGGRRRYEFSLREDESADEMLTDAALQRLFRQFFGFDRPRDIIRKTVYAFHSRLAEQMSEGRVFLAGDAAHIMPVIGSQGMNSGARDVNNLAWKLALVLRAGADPAILASYDVERRPQVASTIRVVTAALHLQKARSIPATFARDVAALILNLFPPVARYVRDMRYIPQPFLGHGLVAARTLSGDDSFVGRLLPQSTVRDEGGERLPDHAILDDVLGGGFAILGVETTELPPGIDDPLWYGLGARVAVISRAGSAVSAPGVTRLTVTDGRLDAVFSAHRGQWLVVRPDRVVAAAADAASFDDITRYFSGLFGLTHPVRQAAE